MQCQAAGHIPVNVKKQNIDMLSLSAHKFHGPRGIGALYVKWGIELTSLMEGGGQERGKRPGTENLPAIMGMAAALKEECTLMEQNEAKVTAMRDRLIQGLSQIPYSILNGSREKRLPGNVNFCFEGVSGESLLLLLDSMGKSVHLPVLPAHQVPWIQAMYFFLLVSLLKSPRVHSESALTFPILRKKSIICWK